MRLFSRPEVIAGAVGAIFIAALLAVFVVFAGPDHGDTRPPERVDVGWTVSQGAQPGNNSAPLYNSTETSSPNFAANVLATAQASAPGAEYLKPMTRPTPAPDQRVTPCFGSDLDYCRQPGSALKLAYQAVDQCPGDHKQKRICLVPLGDVDKGLLDYLVAYFRDRYQLNVAVVSPLTVTEAINGSRRQFNTDLLEIDINDQYRIDSTAVLIGITPLDMYMGSYPKWNYVFGEHTSEYSNGAKAPDGSPAHNQGVISSFRMDPRSYGDPVDKDLMYLRMRKMVSRYIGLMYYNLPQTHDKRSLMYDSITSLDTLDSITAELQLPR